VRPPSLGSCCASDALVKAYIEGSASPVSVVQEHLDRIGSLNPALNAYITVLADSALRDAEESEKRYRAGHPVGPLDGVPVAVKDIFYIRGVRCTAGSKILADNVAPYDAPAVAKLKSAGAVVLGTTNLHEFAAGTTSVNPHYGAVRNPWDPRKVAGGSSGGSAAAVAAGLALLALGTDTAGSVRIPSSLCGVVGLKPTYGRVSRLGVIPLASSLDTVGVISRSCTDAATALRIISGHEEGDLTTVAEDPPGLPQGGGATTRVGVLKDLPPGSVDAAVERSFLDFASRLKELGCDVTEVALDGFDEVYALWLPIRRAEATAFHLKWLNATPELYGEDVRRLLELGRGVLAVDYVNAVNSRPSFIERFASSMKDVDAVVLPCTAVPAPGVDQLTVKVNGTERQVYSALNGLTLPFNYVGFPVLALPSGLVDGTPVGVQLVGKPFDENALLRLGAAYEARFGVFPSPDVSALVQATP
jgi:aspartyl-tRNA(Asn)/glutamyl-tRNA(Gln) amidotransferase subunit A